MPSLMRHPLIGFLLLVFLAAIGVNWPELPFNARLADLIFIPLVLAILALPRARWTWRWFDVAIAAYLLGALPSIIVSPDRRQSVMELARELYLVVIYVVVAIAARQGFARTIGKGLAIGGATLSVAGLVFVALQWIGAAPWPPMGEVMQLPYVGDTLRLRALTASEAMLACILTAAIPFAILECHSARSRTWSMLAAATTLAAGLTFSHAVAGFAVAVLIASWPALAARPRLRPLALAAVTIIVVGLNFAASASIRSVAIGGSSYIDRSEYHHAVDERALAIGDATVTYSVMSYARIKHVAWQAFVEHPLAGVGLDQFHAATARAFNEGRLPSLYREIDPHSTLPGRLAECGVIGGLTLLMLWYAWFVMARDGVGSTLGMATGAALAGLLVSSINADVMNFRFVWVLAGLLRGLQEANGTTIASGNGASAAVGTR